MPVAAVGAVGPVPRNQMDVDHLACDGDSARELILCHNLPGHKLIGDILGYDSTPIHVDFVLCHPHAPVPSFQFLKTKRTTLGRGVLETAQAPSSHSNFNCGAIDGRDIYRTSPEEADSF